MSILTLSWKNLVNKPWSMLLSIVLFALGVGLVSLLFLLEKQLQEKFEKNLGGIDLVVGAKGSPLQLILSSMYHIDAPTGNISLQEARPFLNPQHPLIGDAIPLALGDSYRTYRIVGTTTDFLDLYDAAIAQGKLWEHDFEVVIGASVASALGMSLGSEFNSSHGFLEEETLEHDHETAFHVVGILEPTGAVVDQLILTTPQTYWHVHGESEGDTSHHHHDHSSHAQIASLLEEDPEYQITSLLLRFKARNYQALNMQRNINENTEMQAATPAIEINRLFSLMDAGEQALRLLAIVIIIVSGLSIFISLYSSLKDRKYELALMRVSGASPGTLFLLIIFEGLLLATLGYVAGIIVSHAGMHVLADVMQSSYQYTFSAWTFIQEEWLLLGASLVIGFIAAIIPAVQASRTDIAETLSEGK